MTDKESVCVVLDKSSIIAPYMDKTQIGDVSKVVDRYQYVKTLHHSVGLHVLRNILAHKWTKDARRIIKRTQYDLKEATSLTTISFLIPLIFIKWMTLWKRIGFGIAVGIPTGYILGDLKRKKGLLNLCDTSDTDIAELIRKKIFANGIDTPASQYLIARGYGGVYDSAPFCPVCSAYPAVIGDIQKVKITDDYERSGKAYTKLVYLEGELNDIIYVLNNISIEDMHVFALKDHYVGVEGSIVKYHDHYRATVKVHSVKRHKGLKDDHVAKSQTKKENKSAKSKSRTAALEGMSDNALSTVMDGGIRTSNDIQLSEDEKNMNDPEHVTQTLTDLFTKGVSTTTTGTKSENAIIEQIKHQVLKSTVEEVSKEHIQQVKENARKKHRLVEHVFDNNSNMTEIHTMYHSKDHSLDGLDGKYDNKQYSGTFEDNKQAEKSHFYSISGVMPTTPTGGNTPSFQQVMEEEEEDYDYILEDILGSPVPPDIKIIVHDKDADDYEPMLEDILGSPIPYTPTSSTSTPEEEFVSEPERSPMTPSMYTIDQRKSLLTGSNPFKGYSTVREKGYEMPSTKQFKE